jgi:hypothetical protein
MFFSKRLGKLVKGIIFTNPNFYNKFKFNASYPTWSSNYKCLIYNLVLGCAWKYSWTTCVLAPFSLALTSFDTTSIFITLHPKLEGFFPLFLKDYELDQDFELLFNSFKVTFQCMPNLSISGFSRMVFKHFQDFFHLKDYANGFSHLFQLCFHIA